MTDRHDLTAQLIAARADDDLKTAAAIYQTVADFIDGSVRMLPAHVSKGGRVLGPDTACRDPAALTSPASIPASWDEVDRLVVMTTGPGGTPDDAVFLTRIDPYESAPRTWQIAGPSYARTAGAAFIDMKLFIERRYDFGPPEAPPVLSEAANDNTPGALAPYPDRMADAYTPEAAGGLLGEISSWVTATAIIPVPVLSVAASVALMAGAIGHRILTPTGAGVNVFLVTLMGTAGGKAHPPKSVGELARTAGLPGVVKNGDPTSYAALERIVRKAPTNSLALVMDEFGLTLQDVNGRNKSAPSASIRKFLLAIYDQSNGVFDGRQYASEDTKGDNEPIHGPAFTLMGMTTPETLYEGLSPASISDGFMNRCVFIGAQIEGEVRPPSATRTSRVPPELAGRFRSAIAALPKAEGNIGAVLGKIAVPWKGGEDGAAYRLWSKVFMWQHSTSQDAADFADLVGRIAENVLRLATIRAVSRTPDDPAVDEDDIRWGNALVFDSFDTMRRGIASRMAASPFEEAMNLILGHVQDAGKAGIGHATLLRKKGIRALENRIVSEVLTRLSDSGEIMISGCRGRPGLGAKYVAGQPMENAA